MNKQILSLFLLFFVATTAAQEVNIYTSRHYDSDDALYEEFTKETGIKVNIISSKGGALLERLKSEGKNSPADIFFTVDAGNLWKVQKEGFFKSISSEKIFSVVPKNLRGPNNEWIAVAKRARVIFYNPKNIDSKEIEDFNYEDLANPKWKNRIVIRSSSNMYNQSLVASLIKNLGEKETEVWAKNLVSNFARKPQGNDRSQIIAVANGEADLAVANSYYIGIMLSGSAGKEQLEAARKVKIIFPNQNNRGTHINISGAGILKNSPNPENANLFLEFLLSEKVQKYMVNKSYEYPVVKNVLPSKEILSLGLDFKEDDTSVESFGELNPIAVRLMDKSGWK
ncbi:MAG: Fe(3+) ABC transporter substrate-binding protein [Gammaproteobacteria bacterium]|nr:Fe(3+) ABC transporter substrate-binding protein [Gammaproteobacteria bacterium]|tara:strand:- start:453 stop:1472 length:1020 start_codon:yes stop_codon:yes gene_type:complete